MLIIALVLAVIGLAALVFAVVTSNELVAWVCIAASVLGVVLLIIDALQERRRREAGAPVDRPAADEGAQREVSSTAESGADENVYADYPEDTADEGEESVPNGVGTGQRPAQSAESRSEDEE
ncbi:hypothetical protein A5707_12475 [Mycobacterium kyorinense]|uniref:Transmembrane protein n=1 Tax=Mycobacterium kyorinense TaxID=487514 RepID=A0A1A2ZR85_9MYCO|nr:hypothetical protein [Mycobacterium kyorinense]OBI52213.1 hypothetical protein A5707_12475 [Mycobacterium kyorinense]